MQNIRVAFRQFRKSPGLVITIILTIALGIGANTAIFTLVHAVLMKSLPVVDPKTLYRVGDKDDCCVNGGFMNDDGDFDLFSYELYRHFRDNTPEFEQLAAMQSGNDTMTVRRGSEPAKAQRSEYVSGNYFSTFGIGAFAGRMLSETDDTPGAAPAAVMSYQAWQSDYGSDPVDRGLDLLHSRPAGHHRRHCAAGILWRPDSQPVHRHCGFPWRWSRSSSAENPILHLPDSNWLYVIGRLKPGVRIGPLQAKMSNTLRLWLATQEAYTQNGGSTLIPKQHVVITPGGGGIQNLQQETSKGLYLLMTHLWTGAAGGVRQCGEPAAGAGHNAQSRNLDPHGAGRGTQPADPADADGKRAAGMSGRIGRVGCRLRGDADHPVPGFSQLRRTCRSMPAHRFRCWDSPFCFRC